MKLVTAKEIKDIDNKTITQTGISSEVLMENAGRTSAELIIDLFPETKNIIIIAGSGNNGGDGLVIARHLINSGFNVQTYLTTNSEKSLSVDCYKNYSILKNMKHAPLFINKKNADQLIINNNSLIIDALLGTGLVGTVKGYRKELIDKINSSKSTIVSIDIPSGLTAENQNVTCAIKADFTFTFQYPKVSQILYPSGEYCGKIFIIDISLDKTKANTNRELVTANQVWVNKRKKDTHKYNYGHLAILGGNEDMTGAIILSSKAFFRAGGGLVTGIISKNIQKTYKTAIPEAMSICLNNTSPAEDKKAILSLIENKKITTLLIGPGMGVNKSNQDIIKELLSLELPIIIDAGGLNNLVSIDNFCQLLKNRKHPTILTPHVGEAGKLLERKTDIIINNLEQAAVELAVKTNCFVVLKSYITILAEPNKNIFYFNNGTPGMATAGTGDVLAGIIAAFLSKCEITTAIVSAVYYHALAAKIATQKLNEESLMASDVIEYLPIAFNNIKSYYIKAYKPFIVELPE